jgi:hypothetical protein
MKRIFLGLALSVGMLVMGVTNASASSYCSIDPTIGIGLPVSTSLTVSTSLLGTSTNTYLHNNSTSTTFGSVLGLP